MDDTLPPQRPARGGRPSAMPPSGPDDETRIFDARSQAVGPYPIEAVLGKGGMGKVYRCSDPSLGRQVAIKVLHEKYGGEAEYQARFRREARALASLSHPSVAQIYGIDTDADGSLYIVMELVEGSSVEDRLREEGPLPVEEALRVTRDIAEGLGAALEKGQIHRDVKPSNLLFAASGRVKIVDFGLSKELTGRNSITDEGVVMGTPHYLSPEQGRGLSVDERSDIYSLGSTLYHMLTGHPPFEGTSQIAVIVAHVESDPEPPHRVRPEVPLTVSQLLGKMLAREPADRYAGYGDLIADIDAVLAGDPPPLAASQDGRFGRLGEPEPRSRRKAMLLGGLALLTLGAAVLVGAQLVAAHRQSRQRSDVETRLRRDLGAWIVPRNGPGVTFDLDFRSPPAAEASSEELLSRVFLLPPGSPSARPEMAEDRLRCPNDGGACILAWPFESLDDIELSVASETGIAHWALSVVDAKSPALRRLVLRWSSSDATRAPLLAERRGEALELFDTLPSLPAFAAPYRVLMSIDVVAGETRIDVQFLPSGRAEGSAGAKPWSASAELPGTEWREGRVVLTTDSPRGADYEVELDRWVISGVVSDEPARQRPWPD